MVKSRRFFMLTNPRELIGRVSGFYTHTAVLGLADSKC